MLKHIKNIDALPVFLALALLFLWSAFPEIRKELVGNKNFRVVNDPVERGVFIPEQGEISEGGIRNYNTALDLFYSLDGGENFMLAEQDQIELAEVENPSILYQNTSIRWRHPKGEFPVLKAIMVKWQDQRNHTETKPKAVTYFNQDLGPYPVVSIQLPQSDFLSYENGIMVYGEQGTQDKGFQKDWWYRSANFASRGYEWGREVAFQYFENNELKAESKCEMRISGNATRYFPQKSLKFFPLAENGKRSKLAYPFWADQGNKKSSSFLLRNSGNDNSKTMFADLFMQNLVKNCNVLTQAGKPVSVFVNGNYWGVYNLRERVDRYYVAKKEGVKDKDVTLLYCEVYGDRTRLKSGSKKDKAAFDALIAELPEGDLSDEQYAALKKEISFKSFIDYILIETFFANQDWLHNNVTWYKAGDKKWKWLVNDLDYSLAYPGETNLNANLFDRLGKSQAITAQLFNVLMTHKKFKQKFKERAHELLSETFSYQRIEAVYNPIKEHYSQGIDTQIRRWRFITSKAQWEKDCEKNVTFLRNRRTLFIEQVESL